MWNGTAETLNTKPTRISAMANRKGGEEVAAAESDHHIERETHELDAQEHGHEVVRGHQHEHARG
jgi:hypothetical protein